jgi:predicted TIM-barrel fold metal-dependent hydrolase
MVRKYSIIDADAHVNPPPTFWKDYLPAHLRDLAPRIESGDDADYVVFEGKRKKFSVMSAQAGKKGEDYKFFGRQSDTRPGGWEANARLKDMDQDGMDAAVIYGGGPLGTSNVELYLASYEAYNRWIADFCSHDPDRLVGIAYLPTHDIAFAVDLMRRMAKIGLKGINIPAFPQSKESFAVGSGGMQLLALTGDPNGTRRYDSEEFHPLWEAAIELGMTVNIHLGARSVRFEPVEYFLPDLLMTKFSMAESIAIMIFGGVFERYPDLKFVSVESGVGWFAFASEYMDAIWNRHRHWTKSQLPKPPSYYMEKNVYGSFIHDKAGVQMRHLLGAKNIMWSSDYPHSETTFPHSLEEIAHTFEGVSEEDKYKIICGTAKELYHIG